MAEKKELATKVGNRLRSLRAERTGKSQERFANDNGLDRTYYASIERGEHDLTLPKLRVIASGLNMSMSEVLEGID